ncbi:MAG: hypothetical protein JNM04_02245 [Chthonomonas sp.]|nr:hypothetical protein [Chthonomonas sp.]
MNKIVFAFVLFAGAAVSRASYELVMVGDNDSGGMASSVIHRYDAVSGAYLGYFGANYDPIDDMSVAPSLGRVFTMGNGRLHEYDYSTGIEHRTVQVPFGSTMNISSDNSTLFIQNGNSVTTYSTSTLASISQITLAAGTNTVQSIQVIGSDIFAIEKNTNNFYQFARYSLGGVRMGGSAGQSNIVGKLGYQVGLPSMGTLLLSAGTTGVPLAYSFTYPGLNPTSANSYAPTGITTILDVAPLHVGGAMLGKNPSNAAQGIVAITNAVGGVSHTFGTAQLKDPVAVVTVVAPEPMTMVGMVAGLVTLACRRRTRCK